MAVMNTAIPTTRFWRNSLVMVTATVCPYLSSHAETGFSGPLPVIALACCL